MSPDYEQGIEPANQLLPSLIDRLSKPDDFRSAIRRDLERMLNTRWRCVGAPAELKELDVSLINYGLPDCTAGVGSGREELRRTIERAIQKFEPRFRRVTVKLMSNSDAADRTLRFRIDAVLHETSEQVVFDSALETSTAAFSVKRAGR